MRAACVLPLLLPLGWLACGPAAPGPASPAGPTASQTKPAEPRAPLTPAARLERGLQRLERSDYRKAEADLRAAAEGDHRARALTGLAEVLLMTGRYREAAETARELGQGAPRARRESAWLRGEALRRQGRLEEAEAALREVEADPEARRARLVLGEVLLEMGRRGDAEGPLMTIIADYNEGRIGADDGPGLALAGRAGQLLRSPREANEWFDEAERAVEGDVRTLLWRAELFLERYNPGDAEQVTKEALTKAPRHPEALVWMAHVKLVQAYDFDAAERLAREALAVDPKLARAHFVLAGIALRDMQLELAEQHLAAGLRHNPRHLELLSLAAAVRFLSDDDDGFEDAKRKVLLLNPSYSRMYQIIGEYAEWEHRYDEIVEMMRDAVVLDREDAKARATLGLNLIRAGRDQEGVQQLERAIEDDPFNVRVHNTLNLFQKVIPAHYVTVSRPPFTIRYHQEEQELLDRYVPALLQSAWTDMVASYGFTPDTPVGIELYAERQNFSIRTSGLPNTGIQGVCFGRTLAAVSPMDETFNLGMTLWHELAHVFHIQLSRSHVPRWFTEGLAEYETLHTRPEWKREHDADLFAALRAERLPRLTAMNRAFTRAEHMSDMATAYYASTQILVMLRERYDRAQLAKMMRLWGEGKRTPAVIQEALGVSADELDRQFRDYLRGRLGHYTKQFVPRSRPRPLAEARAAAKRAPGDADAQTEHALAALHAGRSKVAEQALASALKADPAHAQAWWLRARVAMKKRDQKGALRALTRMIEAGHDGYVVQMLAAELAVARRDVVAARAALLAAHQFDPSEAEPLATLAHLARTQGRTDDELEALRKLARIQQHEASVYRRLLELLVERQLFTEAVAVGEAAIHADLKGLRTHQLFASALLGEQQTQRAVFELESALLCAGRPPQQADVHAQLAEVHLAAGRRRAARRHASEARKLDPNNSRLGQLRL